MLNHMPRSRERFIFFALVTIVIGSVLGAIVLLAANFHSLNSEINRMDWSFPATVYAEPPVLATGKQISSDWLTQYLHRLNYVAAKTKNVRPGEFFQNDNAVTLGLRSFDENPSKIAIVTFGNQKVLTIQDPAGRRIDHLTLEPTPLATLFGSDWEKRTLVKLNQVPKPLVEAVVAIEDRHFFQHPGIDALSIARAAVNDFFNKGPLQGGSTITQQLAKNLYLSPERTLQRKINEAMLAILMELKYSKDQILEMYLNEVYLGQKGAVSIRGVGEASRLYFRKDARLLTVPEAAMLAGLIQAPGRYDPYRHPERTLERRNTVLAAMRETGALSSSEYDQYVHAALNVKEPERKINRAPYFLTFVKKQLQDQFSSESLHEENYKIISTLDYDMQIAAQETLAEGLARVEKMRGRTKRPIQGSLIAIEPATGKIRAFVGGRNFVKSQFDRVTQAHRQPGSSFKPIVYAAALETAFESGTRYYTPATLVEDEPWSVRTDQAVWQPRNSNGGYNGIVSLRTALAKSMNIATAKVAYDIGLDSVSNVAHRMGFRNVKPYPSMALGAFEVTPYELARAYTAFANGGKLVELQSIEHASNSKGDALRSHTRSKAIPVLHAETAYLITDMLKTVMTSGTAASVRQYGLRQHIAGKTGTTNDFKDAWFVGYTPDLVCLVWVGYDDNTPVKMTGARAALPIWAKFMQKVQGRISTRDFAKPRGIVEKMIDAYTGKLASPECPSSVRELFIAGTEPLQQCTLADYLQPMENFIGPEPRIQQAGYYTDFNTNYGGITFDHQNYTYKNYDDDESTDQMIDYSDVDPDLAPDTYDEPSPEETSDQNETTSEPDLQEGVEDVYHSSIPGDDEAEQSYETEPDQNAMEPDANDLRQQGVESGQDNNTPFSIVPPVSNKRKHVYTNEDLQPAQTTETSPN